MNTHKTANKDLEAPLLENEYSSDTAGDNLPHNPLIEVKNFKIFNATFSFGFVFGAIVHSMSLCIVSCVYHQADPYSIVDPTIEELSERAGIPLALYYLARYWFVVAFVLPPFITVQVLKFRARRNNDKEESSETKASVITSNMESFLECARFQLGTFLGSICIMSLFCFYATSKTTAPGVLMTYYVGCIVSASLIICLIRTCVEQTCSGVKSIDIVVRYGDDTENDEKNTN
eukprot:CAMPEP_0116132444 /NCGR_PEP_ID=MMETSP0329-20121206/9551_1 /TAXON_ID=697910 /ORGANISM="Pseudo-nitzschia arenysensis, Strain B593" /LENGTH=231 /DNA_ID=CAMNT_0003626959 /DNA_START=277 /DNA_END=972 /DNA_ORIENTATION=+